ncbi:TetR/AcrR family transcriptional regulator [Paenibacillus sp. CAU 1782]
MNAKRGRPRSLKTKENILSASYELLLESGFENVTIEKIAERAGVGKASIYKWWPNKAAVIMDGFFAAAADRLPLPDCGSAVDDVYAHASGLCRFMSSAEGKMITEIIGQGQMDAGLAEAYRTRYIMPRRLEAVQLLERGVQKGELRESLDKELSVDLLYGPIFYRLLVTGEPIDDLYVRSIVDEAFKGFRP